MHGRAPAVERSAEAAEDAVGVFLVHVDGDHALRARSERKERQQPGATPGVEHHGCSSFSGAEGLHGGVDGLCVPGVAVGVEQHVGKVGLYPLAALGGVVAAAGHNDDLVRLHAERRARATRRRARRERAQREPREVGNVGARAYTSGSKL